jgi:hypothetical protein
MKIITAPDPVPMRDALGSEVFLAGSIEQGKARDWQPLVCTALEPLNVLVFNPRRKVWDPTWDQDVSNPELVAQVNWELDLIDRAEIVFFYFQAGTKSPISFLEFGMQVRNRRKDLVVVCEDGFWRQANIQITADRNNVKVFKILEEGIEKLVDLVQKRSLP